MPPKLLSLNVLCVATNHSRPWDRPPRRYVDPLEVRLPRGAAIVGRVFDPVGLPAVAADVRVRRVLAAADRGGIPINVAIDTDDLGEFRVGSLPAGDYAIYIEPQPGQ